MNLFCIFFLQFCKVDLPLSPCTLAFWQQVICKSSASQRCQSGLKICEWSSVHLWCQTELWRQEELNPLRVSSLQLLLYSRILNELYKSTAATLQFTSLELLFACLCDSAHKCFKNVNIESFVLQTDSCRAAWPTYQWVTKQFFIVRYVFNSSWYKWFIRFWLSFLADTFLLTNTHLIRIFWLWKRFVVQPWELRPLFMFGWFIRNLRAWIMAVRISVILHWWLTKHLFLSEINLRKTPQNTLGTVLTFVSSCHNCNILYDGWTRQISQLSFLFPTRTFTFLLKVK